MSLDFNAFLPPAGTTLPGFGSAGEPQTPGIAPPTVIIPINPQPDAGGGILNGILNGLGFPFNLIPGAAGLGQTGGRVGGIVIQVEEFAYTFLAYLAANALAVAAAVFGLYLLFGDQIRRGVVFVNEAADKFGQAAELAAAA